MSNNSSSSSNDEYPSTNDSNWTTPDLDLVWLLPEEDLNAMLAAADQLQVDLNSIPAIANAASNDIGNLFGDDACLDPEMLALLQNPQTLAQTLDAFDVNIAGGTGGYMPSHAQHAEQGMPPTRNVRGALPSSVNGATIASTGHQPTTTLPRFVDDNRGGHLAPSHADVQHAGTVPYYNGPPQGTELPFGIGRQGDWTGLPTQNFDKPANAYQQWQYGAGPVQQFGLGNANLQHPPPGPPPPTYGPTTHALSQFSYGTPVWQQAPPSFHAGQGTRAPLTFAETVNEMGFEAWAAQPPPRSVGFPDRARPRRPTGQRGRREPGAPAPLPGPSQSGTARGAPVADTRLPPAQQGQFPFPLQGPSAPGMAQEFWMAQLNGMPAPRDCYAGMAAFDPSVHGRDTLAAARTVRDNDAPQRTGPSRPAAVDALGDEDTSQSAPRRQRPQPPPADEGSSSQAVTHGAPMPAPDATAAMPPAASNSAAPRARGKKRARTDEEQLEPAPRKGKKARSAPAAAGPSTTQGQALEEPSERDPDRFRQFCARVGAGPGETPGAGPSTLGHNVQDHNNFVAHSGTQENDGEVKKIRIWDGPESARPTPEEGKRYPLHGPRPKDHDWYCRVCHDSGWEKVKRLYWQTVEKAQLHVGREHPVKGDPRHVIERGKGSGTKRKKQQPKDEERREEDKDKEGKD